VNKFEKVAHTKLTMKNAMEHMERRQSIRRESLLMMEMIEGLEEDGE
jgi:hypothetical protein